MLLTIYVSSALPSDRLLRMQEQFPVDTAEHRVYVEFSSGIVPKIDVRKIKTIMHGNVRGVQVSELGSFLEDDSIDEPVTLEVGPRLNTETPWGTRARLILGQCGIENVVRIERSICYRFSRSITNDERRAFFAHFHDDMLEVVYEEPPKRLDAPVSPAPLRSLSIEGGMASELVAYAKACGFEVLPGHVERIQRIVAERGYDFTDAEGWTIWEPDSDHSRHHGFSDEHSIDGVVIPQSFMKRIKGTYEKHPGDAGPAFDDDASGLLAAGPVTVLFVEPDGRYVLKTMPARLLLKMESHNHPTYIEPYHGTATGVGGLLRDIFSPRRGGHITGTTFGMIVGACKLSKHPRRFDNLGYDPAPGYADPRRILLEGREGAYGYTNPVGYPLVTGFVYELFGDVVVGDKPVHYESLKPVAACGGIGWLAEKNNRRRNVQPGYKLILLGGSSEMPIGLGGGSASSTSGGSTSQDAYARNRNSVQRGDPAMESPVIETTHHLALRDDNPIEDEGDLGAGGIINNVVERAEGVGVDIEIEAITEGRKPKLAIAELIANESQERATIVTKAENVPVVLEVAAQERCPAVVIGTFTGDNRIRITSKDEERPAVDLSLNDVLSDRIKRPLSLHTVERQLKPVKLAQDLTFEDCLEIWQLTQGGCKKWLGDMADRSVRGQVAQQPYVGSAYLPVADYGLVADGLNNLTGHVHSIGLAPFLSLIDPGACARMSVAEMLLNMVGCVLDDRTKIKMIANWMWPFKAPGEGERMNRAVDALCEFVDQLILALIGGKDSLSMIGMGVSPEGSLVSVPSVPTLVISGSAPVRNIMQRVTPDLKAPGNLLYLIDLSGGHRRLGGTQLAMIHGQVGDSCADVHDVPQFIRAFTAIQCLVRGRQILSLHDRSDDGLITALCEMAFASSRGIEVRTSDASDAIPFYFNGELGLVAEVEYSDQFERVLGEAEVPFQLLGMVTERGGNINIHHNDRAVLDQPMVDLREKWMERSFQMDEEHANPKAVAHLRRHARKTKPAETKLTFTPKLSPIRLSTLSSAPPKVAILREVGSNGHREMADMFMKAGFEAYDVPMTAFESGKIQDLSAFEVAVPVGGFSHSDVPRAGVGWSSSILLNPRLAKIFQDFRNRPDTLILGVCNGCQLLAQMGWVPDLSERRENEVIFAENTIGRFVQAFVPVEFRTSPSVWCRDMVGSIIPMQIAHREGRVQASPAVLQELVRRNLIALTYTDRDEEGNAIWNGSPLGIAGITSADGRVLAMMPHVERGTGGPIVDDRRIWQWQWPDVPHSMAGCVESPLMQMAISARTWCEEMRGRLVS